MDRSIPLPPPLQDEAPTTGSDQRPSRDLDAGIPVDLVAEIEALRAEQPWPQPDRNSRTIVADGSLRVTLTALRDGATIGSDGTDDSLAVHCLEGSAVVEAGGSSTTVDAGRVAGIRGPGGWRIRAIGETVLLLAVALGERVPDRR